MGAMMTFFSHSKLQNGDRKNPGKEEIDKEDKIDEKEIETEINNSIRVEERSNEIRRENIIYGGLKSLETKYFRGARWMKIFYHNAAAGVFNRNEDVMLSLDVDRFSVLGYVNEMFLYDGKYELMVECPGNDAYKSGFVWWRQSLMPKIDSPLEVSGECVEGFWMNPVSTWNESYAGAKFTGLSRSSSYRSLFDATSTGYWYWAIGMTSYEKEGLVPCHALEKSITLWIRVPNEKDYIKDGRPRTPLSLLSIFLIQ